LLAGCLITVPPVTAVHEHVHQWAGQDQQEGQGPEEVGPVFAQQKVCGDSAEYEKSDGISGAPKRRRAVLVGLSRVCMVVIHLKSPRVKLLVFAASIRRHA
jgi:hypothetical protein